MKLIEFSSQHDTSYLRTPNNGDFMKNIFLSFGLFITFNLYANSNLDCVKKVTEFYGLKENTSIELHGMNNGKKCILTVTNQKYISGLNQKESNVIAFNFDSETSTGKIGKGIWTGLSSNEDMVSYNVSNCEIKNNELNLVYNAKEKFVWKKKHKISLTSSAKAAHMIDKESGLFSNSGKVELNCNF